MHVCPKNTGPPLPVNPNTATLPAPKTHEVSRTLSTGQAAKSPELPDRHRFHEEGQEEDGADAETAREVRPRHLAASGEVEITVGSMQTFPTGGQITVLGGLTTATGGALPPALRYLRFPRAERALGHHEWDAWCNLIEPVLDAQSRHAFKISAVRGKQQGIVYQGSRRDFQIHGSEAAMLRAEFLKFQGSSFINPTISNSS